jgi:hypothetical protein
MNEIFERDIGCAAIFRDFVDRHSRARTTCEKPASSRNFTLAGLRIVGLRAGVQLDRRQVHFEQAHVLDDQRIGAGFVSCQAIWRRLLRVPSSCRMVFSATKTLAR